MSGNSQSSSPLSFLTSWSQNSLYFDMLKAVCRLSKLFSENSVPYIDYRIVENLFCKYYQATNDARLCTAFDARINTLGVGIKTFILGKSHKTEKVAEFNQLRDVLNGLSGVNLAKKLGELRNERIDFSVRTYNVTDMIYHIIGREDCSLRVFNCDYPYIQIDNIGDVKQGHAGSISFTDGLNRYRFNNSKSVLMMQFDVPQDECVVIDTPILDDPYEFLERLLQVDAIPHYDAPKKRREKGKDYVVLPLYSFRHGKKQVPLKSGLNQWNASGRPRNPNEVYIKIPRKIHELYPDFFPRRDNPFVLNLPNGECLSAKVCQDGSKALMSNPNSALGEWILRDVLNLPEGQLVTYDTLKLYGIDSVLIEKTTPANKEITDEEAPMFSLQFITGDYENYDDFIDDEQE